MAWKVPLWRFVERGLDAEGIVRCESAPGPSPFFKEGDELWDLKGIPAEARIKEDDSFWNPVEINAGGRKETSPPIEWAIWNATSGRLVVKAENQSIWQLCYRMRVSEQPKQCRLTAEVLEVPADGGPPAGNSEAAASLSWVTRSAQEFDARWESEGKMIRVLGSARMAEDSLLSDIKIDVTCALNDQPVMKFNSTFPIQSGKPIWVARDFDGKKGMDLRISSSFELLDGTPVAEIMLLQKGDQADPIKVDRHEFKKYRIGKKSWLAIQFLSPNELMNFSPSNEVSEYPFGEAAPFSESTADQLHEKLGLLEVEPPKAIRTWFDGPVLNVCSLFQGMGMMSDGSRAFVGYDPLAKGVFLLSDDPDELGKFEQLLLPSCNLSPEIIIASFNGGGQTRLVSTSGVRCCLERSVDEHQVIRSLVIEPLIGESGDIEMRIDYRDESDGSHKQSLKSAVTLNSGETSVLLNGFLVADESSSLRLSAIIQSVYDMGEELR